MDEAQEERELYVSWKELKRRPKKPKRFYVSWAEKSGLLGPGHVWLLAAPTGSFKSIAAINVAHSLLTGEPVFGVLDVAGKHRVLFLDKEVGEDGLKDRLDEFYQDGEAPDGGFFASKLHRATEFDLDDYLSIPPLKKAIDEIEPTVLVIDCLNPFMVAVESEESFKAIERTILTIQKTYPAIGIILIHHMREPPQGVDPLSIYNVRGHGKLKDMATAITTMVRNERKSKAAGIEAHLDVAFKKIRHGPDVPQIRLEVDKRLRMEVNALDAILLK